jgi:hypothetical protein
MSNSIGTGFSPSANGSSGFTTGSLGSLAAVIPGLGLPYKGRGGKLGGGLPGLMPQPLIIHDNSDTFARTRITLREAWNTTSYSGSSNSKRIITPFRAVNNAGDLLSRNNYSCGGTCQTFQSRPNLKGLRQRFGSTSVSCRPSVIWSSIQIDAEVPSSTCNVKYVYDGSDYTKFKKNQAVNRNYNDRSFGGNDYSTSQSAIRHIRRY